MDPLFQDPEGMRRYMATLSDDEVEAEMERFVAQAKEHPLYNLSAEYRESLAELEQSAERFSDAVAHEVATKLVEEAEADRQFEQARQAYEKLRRALITSVLEADVEKREDWLKMTREIVAVEKAHGQYKAEDWAELDGLL